MNKKKQVHKRVVILFMKEVLEAYNEKRITLDRAMEMLDLSRSNFFRYLKAYREAPSQFGIEYLRKESNHKISVDVEKEIEEILRAEKKLIDDERMIKIKQFNFQALSEELARLRGVEVSSETIRRRAISLRFHSPKPSKVKVYREVETSKVGRLFQHDASFHQWSPFMNYFYLILTVDDHSRRILYARFFGEETSMNHILSIRDTVQQYGLPLAYYTDRHSIFVYTPKTSHTHTYQTVVEDAQVQWRRVLDQLQIQGILAQSPEAKGKVESKFKYLQARVVRRCAKEEVTTLEHAQRILDVEVDYYNNYRKHEITGQTPKERWELAVKEKRTVLRTFQLKEGQSLKDIFCLEYHKKLDKYGKTKIKGVEVQLKKVATQKVIIRHLAENGLTEIRIFQKGLLLKVFKI